MDSLRRRGAHDLRPPVPQWPAQEILIDEIHTPDSSRFWLADSYEERFEADREPENFDKEFIRLWFHQQGYSGDGPSPRLVEDMMIRASQRYQAIYERITGRDFEPGAFPIEQRIEANLRRVGWIP